MRKNRNFRKYLIVEHNTRKSPSTLIKLIKNIDPNFDKNHFKKLGQYFLRFFNKNTHFLVDYCTPVCPKPPIPLSVSLSLETFIKLGYLYSHMTSWAILSPL